MNDLKLDEIYWMKFNLRMNFEYGWILRVDEKWFVDEKLFIYDKLFFDDFLLMDEN